MTNTLKLFHQKKPFIAFVTGGDGGVDYCVQSCLALIEAGVDILELGLPFSDPIADGPVIQKSSMRSLALGTTPQTLLHIGKRLKEKTETPLVLMSYFNPLLQAGESYYGALKESGFDGVIVVDLPLEESLDATQAMKKAELSPIFILSPSTSDERIEKISDSAEGFLYYACQKGTTGVKSHLPLDFAHHAARIRKKCRLPFVVGFGIADSQSAKEALTYADGFVVGSFFVKLMEQKAGFDVLKNHAKALDPR